MTHVARNLTGAQGGAGPQLSSQDISMAKRALLRGGQGERQLDMPPTLGPAQTGDSLQPKAVTAAEKVTGASAMPSSSRS